MKPINHNELKQKVSSVIEDMKMTVVASFGPNGNPSIVSIGNEKPYATKDGITILSHLVDLYSEDSIEKRIALLIKQSAERTALEVGDGTTTTVLLLSAMLDHLTAFVRSDFVPNYARMQKEFEECFVTIDNEYRNHSNRVEDSETIKKIAKTSSNGDEEIAELIANSFDQIGKNGTIIFEESEDNKTSVSIKNGFWFNGGFASSHFCNVENKQLCCFQNPLIFVTSGNLIDAEKLLPIFSIAQAANRPVIIVADSVEGQALKACLAANARKNSGLSGCSMCIVNPPGFGIERYEMLKDIAAATGAKFWQKGAFQDFSGISLESLGTCKKASIGLYHSHFEEPVPNDFDLENRISQLKDQIVQEPLQEVCIALQTRLSRLCSSLAVIRVGGNTYGEMVERKHRVEDAISAVHSALNRGYVSGAGITGMLVHDDLAKIWHCSAERMRVEPILTENIVARQALLAALKAQFDALESSKVDLSVSDLEIFEPTNCFLSALKNAISVLLMLYCSSSFLLILKENQ